MGQLHVVFNLSAAETLRKTLREIDRGGSVFGLEDDFSFGPIGSADPALRARWVEDALGYSGWADVSESTLQLIKATTAAEDPPIAWISPDSARSVAGFLWWLSQIGDGPVRQNRIDRMGLMNPDRLRVCIDGPVQLTEGERKKASDNWQALARENAALRVLSGSALVSAPLTVFDDLLLSNVQKDWKKMALVVGTTLATFYDDGVFQTCDLVLASRLRALARSGTIEWRGDLDQIVGCEVRLAQRYPATTLI